MASRPGYLFVVERVLGKALKIAHQLGGYKARYTLVTDRTTDPPTTSVLDIYMNPTPTVHDRQRVGGRFQEVMSAAGNLSAEALPIFGVSRENLKVGTTYHDPTTDDFFQALDKSGVVEGPRFDVQQTTPIGFIPGGWLLQVKSVFHSAPSG